MMEKPIKRTIGIMRGHSLKTTPMEYYNPEAVDAYIAHLEQRAEAAETDHDNVIAQSDDLYKRLMAAEALLAELAKQEPRAGVVTVWPGTRSCDFHLSRPLPVGEHDVFTRPAPASLPPELPPITNPELQGEFLVHENIRRKGYNQAIADAKSVAATKCRAELRS